MRFFLAAAFVFAFPIIALAQKFDGLALTPPMGWNSWNTFQTHIDEKLIEGMADAMVSSGMRDAGYVYIVLDDGWDERERDADGNLVGDLHRFPNGMKALGDYLHAHGFKFGIYNCAGTKTCAGYPGGHGHELADAKMYASWGVDYLKYDWCNTQGLNPQDSYNAMRDALHAAGRPVVFSMCEWGQSKPWTWAANTGHLWRTYGDITDVYEGVEKWSHGWKVILDQQVGLEKYAGPDHWNDPDMLEVGNRRLTYAESRGHFSLWCILAAPLIAGNDVRHMKPEIHDILTDRDVLAIDQDPLGKQGFRVLAEPTREIWAKELSGGDWAVAVLNTGKEPATLGVSWSQLPFLKGTYSVRDLWANKDLGDTSTDFSGLVASHDVALLRLHPAKAQ
jgi:alpha-galactosidase